MISKDFLSKIDLWVIPTVILLAVVNDVFNKIIIAFLVIATLCSIGYNNTHNQRAIRMNRRFLPRTSRNRRRAVRGTGNPIPRNSSSSSLSPEKDKKSRYNLSLPIKRSIEGDSFESDSIHSFDLSESLTNLNQSLISSFTRPSLEVSFDDSSMTHDSYFGHDAEIEAFLTPWGPQEFQKYKEEIENVKIQDNGSYLSDEEIASWRKKYRPEDISLKFSSSI